MTESKKGNIFIILEMILWSLFPIISFLGLNGVPVFVSLFWVNIFAVLFFFSLVLLKDKLFELKNKRVWVLTIGVVVFINVLFYGFYFLSLKYTTPANASIVSMFEIITSYIFFQIIKKEHFSKKHILGICLAVIGALIVLLPKAGSINPGDYIMLLAVIFPPFGNWCQQQIRKHVSSYTALFLRHLLSIPFLILMTYIFNTSIFDFNISNVFWWLLLNGVLVFGLSKIFWLEAIHRMSVTKALAINGLNPIFTLFFAWLILNQHPTLPQLFSLPFLLVAVYLLTDMSFLKNLLKYKYAEKI
ncbi:MAG: DMT family transporter [Candidatus Pacebacteria bacterium]|nr:DMT family transporter [Candidatus Paceibacterota bacterium]